MEVTLRYSPQLLGTRPLNLPVAGNIRVCNGQLRYPLGVKTRVYLNSDVWPVKRSAQLRGGRSFCVNSSDQLQREYVNADGTLAIGTVSSKMDDGAALVGSRDDGDSNALLPQQPNVFRNRFLDLVRLSSVLNNAADSFFKSEMRRRLFVTAVLLVISRVGYYVPLPGFDRRLMPQDYLNFVSGSVDELGDFTAELKLSFFQLGISPQIFASILMQVLCHVVPSLIKLRKEGLDGHEMIRSYMCV